MCVDIDSGRRVWHYQLVHHGVWDYDSPTAPNLLDITVDGRTVKPSRRSPKQGFVYAFDRVTGQPICDGDDQARDCGDHVDSDDRMTVLPLPDWSSRIS